MKQQLLLLFTLFTALAFSQNMIKGIISDIDGVLPFANVIIKDTTQGITTDENGFFSIEAKSTDSLEVSYLGFKSKTIEVGNQKNIEIVLDDYEQLNQVVIKGYSGKTYSMRLCCGYLTCKNEIILEADSKTIKLYPNPSKNGVFNFKTTKDFSKVTIVVADINGRVLSKFDKNSFNSNIKIDLSNQPTGLYIINVSSNGTQITSRKAIRL